MADYKQDIENTVTSNSKLENPPFLPQYGALTYSCKKKKCCRKYKRKGKHCGGCPKK